MRLAFCQILPTRGELAVAQPVGSRWIQTCNRTPSTQCVDVEAYDAAVRTAVANGRLASLHPALLGRFTESAVLSVIQVVR